MAFWDLLFCFLTLSSSIQRALSGPLQTVIHGGTDASPTEFPYAVSITTNNMHGCGGAILTEKFVLSAAHCFGRQFNLYKVIAGEYNLNSIEGHEQFRDVKGITNHPGYRTVIRSGVEEFRNDIAIVELETNFNLNERVQTIHLPQRKPNFTGIAVLCGWGATSVNGPIPSILQKADFKILSDQECKRSYEIRKKDICAEGDGESKGACGGDSGSPLAQNGVLIGVVSSSDDCTLAVPTIFTKVSFYIKWINETIS